MASSELTGPKPFFSLAHGRYHDGSCWERVQEALKDEGFDSCAPTFDIENTSLTLDDHAAVLVQAEKTSESDLIVRDGWSWGANIVLRRTNESPVAQIQLTAPSLQEETFEPIIEGKRVPAPPEKDSRYTALYMAWKNLESHGHDDQELAKKMGALIFYSDIDDPNIISVATNSIRNHPRHDGNEPFLEDYQEEIPKVIFIPTADQVLRRDWLWWQALILNAKRVGLEGSGHSPMYSRPRELAAGMINEAKNLKPTKATAS